MSFNKTNHDNLLIRTISALIFLALSIICTYLGGIYFTIFMAGLLIRSIWEIICSGREQKIFLIRIIAIIVVSMGIIAIILMRNISSGLMLIMFFIFTAGFSDTLGYFIGKYHGKNRGVFPCSLDKSIEGTLAALLLPPLIMGSIFINFIPYSYILSLILAISAVTGDLLASYFKRIVKIKDFPTFIPGHGGLLDRIDSQIIAGLVLYLLIITFHPAS